MWVLVKRCTASLSSIITCDGQMCMQPGSTGQSTLFCSKWTLKSHFYNNCTSSHKCLCDQGHTPPISRGIGLSILAVVGFLPFEEKGTARPLLSVLSFQQRNTSSGYFYSDRQALFSTMDFGQACTVYSH